MTLGEIHTLVQDRLGDRTGLASNITTEVKYAQQQILEKGGRDLPWFLEKVDQTLVVPIAQSISLPTGFLRLMEPPAVFSGSTEYCKVSRGDLKLDGAKGKKYFAIAKDTLYLPDQDTAAVTLDIDYYTQDTTLSETSDENEWGKHAPGLLIGYAGRALARKFGDVESMQFFQEEILISQKGLLTEIVAREEAGRQRTLNRSA